MSLERKISLMQMLVTNRNFFFDLPHELQLKILVINLINDLPSNFLLARKQLFVKHEKATILSMVDMWGIDAFDLKMQSGSYINSPHYRFLARLNKPYYSASLGWYRHYTHAHAQYATPIDDVYYEVIDWQSSFKQDNGRMPAKLCDALHSPVVNKIIDHMRVNKLADFLRSRIIGKKELQQSCDENGIKWFKSWTIKRLKKELMAT